MNNVLIPRPEATAVRILSLNLWQRFGAWEQRRAVLIEGIRSFDPDLVAFDESVTSGGYDQARDLLGAGYAIAHSTCRDPSGMGTSVASRWPLGRVEEVDLHVSPRTEGFPCSTLIAEVLAPDPVGPLLFVNHFPSWQLNFEYERELQAVAAARAVEARLGQGHQHVVMAGDFDADPGAASTRFWSGRQSLSGTSVCYRDAWESAHPGDEGHTFTPINPLVMEGAVKGMRPFRDWPFRRIDYIFIRQGAHGGFAMDVAACERIFDTPVNGIQASDHYGLCADLAVFAED